jgi:hypothetical protein
MTAERKLIAYETAPSEGFELVPAPHGRGWMDATYDRSAYRCLPLLMANQAGWLILNPWNVRVKWDGGSNLGSVEIQRWEGWQGERRPPADHLFPMSHFGVGIVTWTLPFLFRTPDGYNLLVRGPANTVKDGIAPLEGIVETDWTPATFTMNWKITRPDTWIMFEQREPLCMIVPQRRGELEEFAPQIQPIESDPGLDAANAAWCASRDKFNEAFRAGTAKGWERHYFQGGAPDGSVAADHQTRLHLQQFTR